jgi:hypothetical protein
VLLCVVEPMARSTGSNDALKLCENVSMGGRKMGEMHTWFVLTQTTSSMRWYPQTSRHSRPTSIARPVTQRNRNPSSWSKGIGIARISSSFIVPYGSCDIMLLLLNFQSVEENLRYARSCGCPKEGRP